MKNLALLLNLVIMLILNGLINAQNADYNEVGKRVAIMLQNRHFSDIPFDSKTSRQFLDEYLISLDASKIYFSNEDVNKLQLAFGDNLHSALFQGKSIQVASEIYKVFQKKAKERIGSIKSLINEKKFTHNLNSDILFEQTDTWANNEKEAKIKWERYISDVLIIESLKLVSDDTDVQSAIKMAENNITKRYEHYLKKIEKNGEEDIANLFLSAVAKVYDPHTDFMTSKEMNSFKDSMSNQLVGIGAMLKSREDGLISVIGIVNGGPADLSKELKLNDTIIGIDAKGTGKSENIVDISHMELASVIELVRGEENSSVALKIRTNGETSDNSKIVVIPRGKVPLKGDEASGGLIQTKNGAPEYKLGIITLPSFYSDFEDGKIRCSNDVEKILLKLIEQNIDGLILDLRDNSGGVLEEVRRISGFFLGSGPVVQVKDSLGRIQIKETDQLIPLYAGPMIVLINRNSASASEILAGALQDYNRAVIVGDEATFGKGTVQSPMDIGRELPLFASREKAGSMKMTIQKFYRPSGSSTQLDGVEADIVLPNLNDVIKIGEKYLRYALPHDHIKPVNNLKLLDKSNLFVSNLLSYSKERVKNSEDFSEIIEDSVNLKASEESKFISLNITKRFSEYSKERQYIEERRRKRIKRYAELLVQDREQLSLYKLQLESDGPVIKSVNSFSGNENYMLNSADDSKDIDSIMEWPSGIDPHKREALAILSDLIDMTESSKLVELVK